MSTGRFSKFYHILPGGFRNYTVFYRCLPVSTGPQKTKKWILEKHPTCSTVFFLFLPEFFPQATELLREALPLTPPNARLVETLGGHPNSGLLPRALAEMILAARETLGGLGAERVRGSQRRGRPVFMYVCLVSWLSLQGKSTNLPRGFRNSTDYLPGGFRISTVFYRCLPAFSANVGIHYVLGNICSICSVCSICSICSIWSICSICNVCSVCSICGIGVVYVVYVVYRFRKPYNVARNLHFLPISTAPAPPIYQFLPRRRLRSTNFYRFLPRRGRRFTRKTEQIDREETQFYQFLPGVSKFYRGLPCSTGFCVCTLLPDSTGFCRPVG